MRFKVIVLIMVFLSVGVEALAQKPTLTVKYINQWRGFSIDDLAMLKDVLSEKYHVVNDQDTDDYDLIIDGVFNYNFFWGKEGIKNKKAIKIFFTGEATEPDIDDYDLSIGFGYEDSPKYIRIPLIYMDKGKNAKNLNSKNTRGKCRPKKKFFACFLSSNGASRSWLTWQKYDGVALRDGLFHNLSSYKRVESGGGHLNNRGAVVPKDKTQKFFKDCKFIIAYENQSFPGYITEKVFQAYDAGAIPIYYSDKEAVKDINKKSIIFAHDFAKEEELVEYIKKVDRDDKLYCDIWKEKLITDPARDYEAVKAVLRQRLEAVISRHDKIQD